MSSIHSAPMACKPPPLSAHDPYICGIDSSTGCATCLAYWARNRPRPPADQVAWTTFAERFLGETVTTDVLSLPDRDLEFEAKFFASSAHAEFREAVMTIYASDLRAIINDEIERRGGVG